MTVHPLLRFQALRQQLFSSLRYRLWLAFASTLAILVVFASHQPAQAYQVEVSPSSPQLGDTLAVVIRTEQANRGTAPTITVGDRQYPSFPIGGDRFRTLVPTSPVDQPGQLTLQIDGAESTRNIAVNLRNRSFPTQRVTLAPGRAGLEGTDYEFRRLAELKALVTPEQYWNGPMTRPSSGQVSSVYGVRRYYNGVFAQDYYHRGVDYAAPTGSPAVAPAAGRVVLVGRVADGFQLNGNTVGIDHGQGVASVFIHLSQIDVNEGDFVQAGQRVGAIGSTGFASGPNLHWGLYVNQVAVDPVPWRYDGIE
ncbi:MAG: M23 family metallopeptidase [Cyanobacteria bacterium P01_A01_bin.123]